MMCETCEDYDLCNGKILVDCDACSGTGEGHNEYTTCSICHGKGEYLIDCPQIGGRDEL
jgi:hypothetical protein